MLIFSLPFCLLLPDSEYQVKLGDNDIVTLKLQKVIPKVYDERLPFRGFIKGELENISTLKIYNPKKNEGRWVNKEELEGITDLNIVNEYKTHNDVKIVPKVTPSIIERDINWEEDIQQIAINEYRKKEIDNDEFADNEEDIRRLYYSGRTLYLNCEVFKDRYGRCRYTRIIYESSKNLHYELEFERAVSAINILISQYRYWTDSYWITRVSEREFFFYKTYDNSDSYHGWNEIGHSQYARDFDNDTVERIRESIVNKEIQDLFTDMPFFQLRLDARNAFDQTNYHLSVIYIVTALESVVMTLLGHHHSKSKLKELERVPLTYIISKSLKKIFPFYQLALYIKDITEAIQIRNRIIHQGDINIDGKEAEKILNDVNEFINFILKDLLKKILPQ